MEVEGLSGPSHTQQVNQGGEDQAAAGGGGVGPSSQGEEVEGEASPVVAGKEERPRCLPGTFPCCLAGRFTLPGLGRKPGCTAAIVIGRPALAAGRPGFARGTAKVKKMRKMSDRQFRPLAPLRCSFSADVPAPW